MLKSNKKKIFSKKKEDFFNRLLTNITQIRAVRFLGVGGLCAALSILCMYMFTSVLVINYLISTIITIITTNFIGFYLNKYYTFRTHQKRFWRELWKYYSVMMSSYVLNVLAMYVLVDVCKIWYLWATIILIFVLTPYNYLFHKLWSFKK